MESKIAKRWFVSGTVQGVGFRYFVQHKAVGLGVTGWARNTSDGRVEVYGVGTADRLSDLVASLHIGPRMAQVRRVEEQDAAIEQSGSFQIR